MKTVNDGRPTSSKPPAAALPKTAVAPGAMLNSSPPSRIRDISDMPSSRNGSATTSIPMPTRPSGSQRKSQTLPEAGPKVSQRTCPTPLTRGLHRRISACRCVCSVMTLRRPAAFAASQARLHMGRIYSMKEYRGRRFFRVGGSGPLTKAKRKLLPTARRCNHRQYAVEHIFAKDEIYQRASMTIPTAVNRCWELPGREPHTRSAWPYPNWQSFATLD
jgi:hypothetical protein